MKRSLMSGLSLFVLALNAWGQGNFVVTRTMTDTSGGHIDNVQYYDGLGNPIEALTRDFHEGKGIVSLNTYDNSGRLEKTWNPTLVESEQYVAPAEVMNNAVTVYGDSRPYSYYTYLGSPIDSITNSYGPGNNWGTGKCVSTEVFTNESSGLLKCSKFSIETNGNLAHAGSFAPGSLRVVKTTDEDGRMSYSFHDYDGRVVLSRQCSENGNADTYYIYDDYRQLRYVLPPMASSVASSSNSLAEPVSKYGYIYEYDAFGQCVMKKLPGCEPVLMKYDKGGQLTFMQDGNMRQHGTWTYYLRDRHGRPTVTGIQHSPLPDIDGIIVRSKYVGQEGSYQGYDSNISLDWDNLLSVNYYDSYDNLDSSLPNASLAYHQVDEYDHMYVNATSPETSAKGLLTGSATRVLGANSNTMLRKSFFYDYHGNVIQTHEQNLLGGYEHYYYHLSFTGKPLEVRHEHTTADTINVEILRYTYDNMERLLTTSVERDGAEPVLLCSNAYDGLGRLAGQSLGGTAGGSHAESLAYAYNVRGWTTGITGTNFSQTLHYEDAGENACYNGNIGSVEWSAKELIDETTRVSQQYNYTYDGLNRLVSAAYSAPGASDWDNTFITNNPRDYSSSYTYDLNGNLTAIKRKGVAGKVNVFDYTVVSFGDIDDLSLEYNGNQLKKVSDQCDDLTYEGSMEFKDGATKATEYTYDANGNMTCDRNKGIQSITYNMLNLPQSVMFDDGHETRYTYAADGRKLKVEYLLNNIRFVEDITPIGPPFGGGINSLSLADAIELPIDTASISVTPLIQTLMTRDYCGNHIYRNGALERVLNDVGYADSTGYHYQVKDYRGDVRVVVAQNGTLEETNSYYPYGMLHGTSAIASTQPYKYTGKELDRENGLDMYDFEARMLNSSICYWIMPDPLAELDVDASPYSVCKGNPNSNSDPSGMIVNNIIGGIVGGFAEYGTQVAANLFEKGLSIDVFTDVDIADIAVATVEGAITSGGSVVRRTIVKGTAMAVRNSVDYNVHDGLKIKSAKKAAQAMATEVASSIIKMPIKHVSVFKTKSANKAVNEARAKAHAKGQSLPAKKAKQIATRTRKRNARAKKTNKAVTDKVKSAPGNIGASYVNKQNDKE